MPVPPKIHMVPRRGSVAGWAIFGVDLAVRGRMTVVVAEKKKKEKINRGQMSASITTAYSMLEPRTWIYAIGYIIEVR